MKYLWWFFISSFCYASGFDTEAPALAQRLKQSLVQNLTQKMVKDGAVAAVEFCHLEVKPIAKKAAGADLSKYEFGRTSHKIRNSQNQPQAWMLPYLEKFQGTTVKAPGKPEIHTFSDGKKAYLEALYVGPQCLTCHGEAVGGPLRERISALYPKDQATGFKLGEFRGLVWVKEK